MALRRLRPLAPLALIAAFGCGGSASLLPPDVDGGGDDGAGPVVDPGGGEPSPTPAGGDDASAAGDDAPGASPSSDAGGDDAGDDASRDDDAGDGAGAIDASAGEDAGADVIVPPPPVDAAPDAIVPPPPPVDASIPDAIAPPPIDAGAPDVIAPPPIDASVPDATVPPPADAGPPCTIPAAAFTAPDPAPIAAPPETAPFGDEVREISLTVNGLAYEPRSRRLFASTPSSVGANGNSIVAIDPTTASITGVWFVGSEPTRLALSRDGKFLYTNLRGADAIARFDLATSKVGLQFSLGQDASGEAYDAVDLAVLPQSPRSVLVALGVNQPSYYYGQPIAVFDDGVMRPTTAAAYPYYYDTSLVLASNDDSLAFSVDGTASPSALGVLCIDRQGVTIAETHPVFPSMPQQLAYSAPYVYSSAGGVFDASSRTLAGTFGGTPTYNGFTGLAVDRPANRVYFIDQGYSSPGLTAFDAAHFTPTGSIAIPPLPNASGAQLVRWGRYGLAYVANDGHVVIVRSTLVAQ